MGEAPVVSASSSSLLAPASVVISEIMWMGSDRSTADEWVEIAGVTPVGSVASSPRSLSGWTLTTVKDGGIESVIARFPASITIASGSYLVLSNYGKEASRLAIDPTMTSTTMSLPNTKLLLRLRDAQGVLIDEADDGVGNPFAGANPASNGPKASMERIHLHQPGSVAPNWRSATESRGFDEGVPIFGTPGQASVITTPIISSSSSQSSSSSLVISSSIASSSASFSSVFSAEISSNFLSLPIHVQPYLKLKINELLSNPIGSDDSEWLELKNTGSDPVNLSGMTIRVGTVGQKIRVSGSGMIVSGSGIILIPKSLVGFSLTNNGATVRLESGSTIIDTFTYPSYPDGVSAGRVTGDAGPESGEASSGIIPFCVPTPGADNLIIPPDPQIEIQSGKPVSQAPVTLNLSVTAGSGALVGGSCRFDFGDGFTSDSCNPSSHTMKIIGDYTINMVFNDYCGNTVTRSVSGTVTSKPFSIRTSGKQAKGSVPALCTPSSFSGVSITELLPNPSGDEEGSEWMELRNDTDEYRPLCGWFLDDGAGGSRPFSLAAYELPPRSIIALPRKQSKIALNNDHDMVRLIAPLPAGGTGVLHTVLFDHAPDDESYAVDGSGSWIWTPYPTPGTENRFQQASSVFQSSPLQISAAFPNPHGPDTWDEWIEITNTAGWPIWLNGWTIRNTQGKELDLTGTVLSKLSTKKIYLSRLKYTLGNEQETLELVDTDSVVRSILTWKNAKEEAIQKQFMSPKKKQSVLVRQILDEETLLVQTTDDPESLLKVRLLGVAFPQNSKENADLSSLKIKNEYFIRSLIINKKIDLEFDSIQKDADGITQAYVWKDGKNLQQELLVRGLVSVDPYAQSGRLQEYEIYEAMAKTLQEGLWQSEVLTAYADTQKVEAEHWNALQTRGLTLKADQPEGLIASGTVLQLLANQPSNLYVSINNAPFRMLSGSILLASNQTIRAYAEAQFSDRSPVRSPVIQKTFIADTKAPKRAIRISEVYPSPLAGEVEWIELENRTSEPVSLGGWQLDDAEGKGSKQWMIPADVVIPGHRRLLFPFAVTKISLSNSGDEVRLLYPAGTPADTVVFQSVKKGRAVAWDTITSRICQTDTPTPLDANICFIKNKKSTQKKSKKKAINKKQIQINSEVEKSVQKKENSLYKTLLAQIGATNAVGTYSPIFSLQDGLTFIFVLMIGLFAVFFWKRNDT